jgi:hypothetical protein
MCTRTAAWENDKENADDHMYNQQYSAHPQQKWQSRLQSVVLRDQLYRLPVFLWVHFGDFSLTQHRNRRNHPPTYLAEPHSRAHSRTFAASFWRFSQGHEHYSALTLVRRVLNSASQCERSRQAIERASQPAAPSRFQLRLLVSLLTLTSTPPAHPPVPSRRFYCSITVGRLRFRARSGG